MRNIVCDPQLVGVWNHFEEMYVINPKEIIIQVLRLDNIPFAMQTDYIRLTAITYQSFGLDATKNSSRFSGARHSENLVFRVNLPQILLKNLIIRQYYCVFHLRFENKFIPTKLQRTQKRMIFL